jgi:hypothetical protein
MPHSNDELQTSPFSSPVCTDLINTFQSDLDSFTASKTFPDHIQQASSSTSTTPQNEYLSNASFNVHSNSSTGEETSTVSEKGKKRKAKKKGKKRKEGTTNIPYEGTLRISKHSSTKCNSISYTPFSKSENSTCFITISQGIINRIQELYKPRETRRKGKDFTEHYYVAINSILWQQLMDKSYTLDSYVPVNFEVLKSIVSKRELDTILTNLKHWGIVESDNHYIAGHKSIGYRVAELYRGKIKQYQINDPKIIKKMELHKNNQMVNVGGAYLSHLNEIRIDKIKAEKFIRNKYDVNSEEYKSRFVSINLIHTKQYFAIKDKQGRVHTNLTNLASELRKFLFRNTGEVITEVDIPNSQPIFLYCHLKLSTKVNQGELEDYRKLVESGLFYETLNTVGIERSDFKKKFYTEVLFGKSYLMEGAVGKGFSARFPTIAAVIKGMKSTDHNAVALVLQREESKFIFDCLNKYNIQSNYDFCLTIHDSLVVTAGNEYTCSDIIQNLFKSVHGLNVVARTK